MSEKGEGGGGIQNVETVWTLEPKFHDFYQNFMGNLLMCISRCPMYVVIMVNIKSKVTFSVLKMSFVDRSHTKANFQNRNTLEKLQIRPDTASPKTITSVMRDFYRV